MKIGSNSNFSGYSYTPKDKEENSSSLKSSQEPKQEESSKKNSIGIKELSKGEKAQVIDLQARDAEVKAHEAAHQGGGGGAATYTYQQGPNGKMYAIGGEVSISIEGGSTPEETIANALQVIAAATAPVNPSSQDMSVAASAKSMMIKAQQDKSKELMEETKGYDTYKEENLEGQDSPSAIDIFT